MFNDKEDILMKDFTEYKGSDSVIDGSPCFTAGTMVYTFEGMKPIEDISVGELVYTHKHRFRPVTATGSKKAEVDKIYAQGIPDYMFAGNPLFYVSHMKEGWDDEMDCIGKQFSEPEWVPASKLTYDREMKDYLSSPIITEEYNPPSLDAKTCWLLGRYVADGYLEGYPQLVIPVNKDKIAHFVEMVNCPDFDFHCIPYTESTYHCVFSDSRLVSLVTDHDFGKEAQDKNIPNMILQLPRTLAESFLEGYLSGGGSFDGKRISFPCTTKSKRLAYSLALLIQKVYRCNTDVSFRIDPSYHVEGVGTRHYDIWWTVTFDRLSKVERIEDDIYTPYVLREPAGMKTVYDISVDEDESYLANNRFVHN